MIKRRDVQFQSGDTYAAAWSFLPVQVQFGAPCPAVAIAHGLGAVNEMYLEPFARRFYYLSTLPIMQKKLRVMVDWFIDLLFKRDVTRLKTPTMSEAFNLSKEKV